MAITNTKSKQVDVSLQGSMVDTNQPYLSFGRERHIDVDLTTTAVGDIDSTFELVRLGAGNWTIIGDLSKLYTSAFGASRTLTVGISSYIPITSNAETAENLTAIHTSADVASAGSFVPTTATTAGRLVVKSKTPVIIKAQVKGGTVPSGATIKGFFTVVND